MIPLENTYFDSKDFLLLEINFKKGRINDENT